MSKHSLKFIFITGGTVSGIGKGISVASLGALLKLRGYRVLPIKMDPYLNKDAGTMNPYQHGEVFVTDDGAETDLDLGHYERFMDMNLDKDSNFTTGSVYSSVIDTERRGDFLGNTIQIIPHITGEIKRRILSAAKRKKAEVVIVEIGGTVGDIEAEPFLESVRQLSREYGRENFAFIHVVKIDYVFPSDEEKTKPIQQSVRLLRERGIQPDFLIVRSKRSFSKDIREKISLFTDVKVNHIIEAVDAESLYDVPIKFNKANMDRHILEQLNLKIKPLNFNLWRSQLKKLKSAKKVIKIGLVGKYVANDDAYISVEEALLHSAASLGMSLEIIHINSETDDIPKCLKQVQGIVVPGGFGKRGIEGKIKAVNYARTHNLPFLGLCLGLQIAVVEFSRNVCKLKDANSTEFNPKTKYPVIDFLASQKGIKILGGTMRLGSYEMKLVPDSLTYKLYGNLKIQERHRHRYEINPEYHEILQKNGMIFSGMSVKDKRLVDFIELPKHKFFIATQAHPEFKSRFLSPHPLFVGLIQAVLKK